ncbi:G patch domain and ankyrin repeat-containing protein 1 homolog isoform X2 [Ptychodera flava]|uniref:G patch domain and ankyrin repeat-containing protein 1 homolog isoform X2 n=1 Tax=Ptychodera flava TaxID=63121 RepID=UPI003969F752
MSLISEPSMATSDNIQSVYHQRPSASVRECKQHERRGATKHDLGAGRRSERLVNAFLRNAQNGDLSELMKCLEKGCDINAYDSFSWTALMCASHSGQSGIVHHLLLHGADRSLINSQGQTAVDLAEMAGHHNVVHLLKFYDRGQELTQEKHCEAGDSATDQRHFWCEICKIDFPEVNRTEHKHSTVHLFNSKHTKLPTQYFIPENNVGFQMMIKKGWDREKGLGPKGVGHKYPIKTVLKRDRHCLGSDRKKARVTHFKPNDVNAVQKPKQEKYLRIGKISKQARVRQDKKTKNWERNMRMYFNS